MQNLKWVADQGAITPAQYESSLFLRARSRVDQISTSTGTEKDDKDCKDYGPQNFQQASSSLKVTPSGSSGVASSSQSSFV